MPFPIRALANRRAWTLAAVLGATVCATLGLAPVAAHLAAGRQAEAPRAVRAPISPPLAEARATAALASPAHDRKLLLTAYSGGGQAAAAKAAEAAPAPFRSARSSELDCLTQAVYFEARGETAEGQAAVAQVVLNRVRHPAFPKTVCGVVYQGVRSRGCQFSFACDGSVRRGRETSAWNRAHRVAARALAGAVMPEVGAATHFHALRVNPSWGPGLKRVAQVGLHVFYRLGRGPAQPAARAASPADEAAEVVLISLKAVPANDGLEAAEAAPARVEPPAPEAAPQPTASAESQAVGAS